MLKLKLKRLVALACAVLIPYGASAALLTDPDDLRSWQGATVGTFAQLYYGSNTLANRQLVIANGLLDDGIFNPTGFTASNLITSVGQYAGQGGWHINRPDGHWRLCLHVLRCTSVPVRRRQCH